MNGEQTPEYFAQAQDDLNRRIVRMFKGTFSLDVACLLLSELLYCYCRRFAFVESTMHVGCTM